MFYYIQSDTSSHTKLNMKRKEKPSPHICCYLIVNGRTAAEQNHLGTDQGDEEVLMDGRPVRLWDAVIEKKKRENVILFNLLEK